MANISGDYKCILAAMGKKIDAALNLVDDDGDLSGEFTIKGNKFPFEGGETDGETFQFVVEAMGRDMKFDGEVDGDNLSATYKSGFMKAKLTGEKVS